MKYLEHPHHFIFFSWFIVELSYVMYRGADKEGEKGFVSVETAM
jgi:hypothetical protein